MKTTRRLVCLFLSLVMASCMSACGGETTEQQTQALTTDVVETIETETEKRWKDALPEDTNLDGKNITILTRGDE